MRTHSSDAPREDPNGVTIEQYAQCLLPLGTTTGDFLLLGWGSGRPQ